MSSKEQAYTTDKSKAKQRPPWHEAQALETLDWLHQPATTVQRVVQAPLSLNSKDVSRLQHAYGNRAVLQLLGLTGADTVRAALVGQRRPGAGSEGPVQRQDEKEEPRQPTALQRQAPDDEKALQAILLTQRVGMEGGPVSPEVEAPITRARGGRQPLDGAVQRQTTGEWPLGSVVARRRVAGVMGRSVSEIDEMPREQMVAEYLRARWEQESGDSPLRSRLLRFFRFAPTVFAATMYSRWGVHLRNSYYITPSNSRREAWSAGVTRFRTSYADELFQEMLANPTESIPAWAATARTSYGSLRSGLGAAFRERVENELLTRYAQGSAASEVAPSGMSRGEILELANVQVRAIVDSHRALFRDIAETGVNRWHMPIVEPDWWPHIAGAAAAISSAAGSVVLACTGATTAAAGAAVPGATLAAAPAAGGVLVAIGIPLLVAGAVGGIAASVGGILQIEEQHRRERLEHWIKEGTRQGFFGVDRGIDAQQDPLVIILTVEALKRNIDPGDIAAHHEMRNFAWQQMFGDLPQDWGRGASVVRRVMNAEINAEINRAVRIGG